VTGDFSELSQLKTTRDVFRESLRLYPPVPMMVRETRQPETFRGRSVKPGAQVVISPWHLHRQTRMWDNPDGFDPDRWQTENGKSCQRDAYLPFSAVVLLAQLVRAYRFEVVEGRAPVPVAHLTVRAKDGIWLRFVPRED